jgi:membrane protein
MCALSIKLVDMRTHLLRLFHFIKLVARRFAADGSNQTAASLTYTSLLAIVPLITIGLTIFSAFPAFTEISTSLKVFLLNNMVPEAAGKVITVYMFQFSENAGKLTAIGTALLAVTAFMLMQTIEHALNGIWHVQRERPVAQRFLVYWSILSLGPLLIGASLYVTSYLASLAFGFGHQVHGVRLVLLKVVPVLLTVSAMSLLYLMVPNRYVPARHAWIGGLVAGLSFEAMKLLFSAYVSHFPSYTMVYGTFAALPLFLLWIYLSWMTVLLGATIAATLPYYRVAHEAGKPLPGSMFFCALGILKQLASAQQQGEVLTIRQLAIRTQTSWDQLEQALDQLVDAHWVLRSGKGWALAMHPDHIVVREVFERMVFHAAQQPQILDKLAQQPQLSLSQWQTE